jgi:hypothetical protein
MGRASAERSKDNADSRETAASVDPYRATRQFERAIGFGGVPLRAPASQEAEPDKKGTLIATIVYNETTSTVTYKRPGEDSLPEPNEGS